MKIGSLKSAKILGILNVTPDSFSDGGDFLDTDKALAQAEKLFAQGADFIDIGAQSTRPNSTLVSAAEELSRLKNILPEIHFPFSIDTFYPEVAEFAVYEGASMINCVKPSALDDMFKIAKKYNLPVIATHNEKIKQDVLREVKAFFDHIRYDYQNIIFDVGIGFQKSCEENILLLNNLKHLFTEPLMIGISRKSFIEELSGSVEPKDRDMESVALALYAYFNGATYFRVHNVDLTSKAFAVFRD